MKTYFTKYLPVEGEIKEGDKISTAILPYDVLPITVNKEMVKLGINNGNYKKVKLFLCSRDIKVGDEIFDECTQRFGKASTVKKNEKGKITYVSIKYKPEQKDGWGVFPKETLKVIGEISPDALSYVKEGDEFEENQIEVVRKPLRKWNGEMMVLIKGPCNHFH